MSRLLSSFLGTVLVAALTVFAAAATLHALLAHTLTMQHWPWDFANSAELAGYLLLAGLGALATVPLLGLGVGWLRVVLAHRRLSGLAADSVQQLVSGREVWVLPLSDLTGFTVGVWRPRIFLSAAAVTHHPADTLEAILLHEEEHVKQRAPLRRALLSLLETAWWFVPGARRALALETLRLEVEADDAALRRGAARHSLFDAIVHAADGPMMPAVGLATTGVGPRLERLAGIPEQDGESAGWGLPVALVATALAPAAAHLGLVLGLACL